MAIVAALLALSACAGYAGADYARAACDELSSLVKLKSPSHADVELHTERSAGRAQRAAGIDGAFQELYADLRKIRDEVKAGPGLSTMTEQRADEVLSDVVAACADLEAPIEMRGGGSDLTWRTLNGS